MVFNVHGDVPKVSSKECVHWKPSTFAQDVPTGHVYCWLNIEMIIFCNVKKPMTNRVYCWLKHDKRMIIRKIKPSRKDDPSARSPWMRWGWKEQWGLGREVLVQAPINSSLGILWKVLIYHYILTLVPTKLLLSPDLFWTIEQIWIYNYILNSLLVYQSTFNPVRTPAA